MKTAHHIILYAVKMGCRSNRIIFTMERAFWGQETFTVSQLYMYYKPAFSLSSRFLSRSGLCVLFDFWTDKFKNKDALFIYLVLPYNMLFASKSEIYSSILAFVKNCTKQHSDTKWADKKKILKYYIYKIKRNCVRNTVRMAPQVRIHFQTNKLWIWSAQSELRHVFHGWYH